jgi:hypothetical protein
MVGRDNSANTRPHYTTTPTNNRHMTTTRAARPCQGLAKKFSEVWRSNDIGKTTDRWVHLDGAIANVSAVLANRHLDASQKFLQVQLHGSVVP